MDAAQFGEFLSVKAGAVGHGGAPGLGAHGGRERQLIAKYFRVDTFRGNNMEFDDWAFKLKRVVRSMNLQVFQIMSEAEGRTESIVEDNLEESMWHRSGELYDILCQNTTGEALSVIKMVGDMEGIKAWQVLFRKYNPKTMARGVRLLCEVTNPPKIKDLANIETEINKWEEKALMLQTQFGEELTNKMKIAVFTNMMPVNIQEHIYSTLEEATLYGTVKEKVRAMVQNKIAANMGPAPMDIGEVGHKMDFEDGDCSKRYWNDEEYSVDAVDMNTKCYKCQGYGHMSRDCGTKIEKGKGKGNDVKGG
jgi:hypothetical protein